jgi:2-keto-3-deoxy-L-rhamnonate aldolase RhmA
MPAHNPFKAALAARQAQIGLWMSGAAPTSPKSAPRPASTGC